MNKVITSAILMAGLITSTTLAFGEGIASANVVGYAQSGLRWGVRLATPQFTNVSDGDYKLEDIVPTGSDLSDNIQLDTFDQYGAPEHSYIWIEWGKSGDGKYWTEDYENPATGVTLKNGEGLSVTARNTSQGLQTSGQVSQNDLVYQLRWGVSLCGNAFPTKVALQDILPSGPDLSDNIQFDTFDEYGAPAHSYMWIEWGKTGTGKYWTEDYENPAEGVTIAAGEGFSITARSDEQYITIPAPEF